MKKQDGLVETKQEDQFPAGLLQDFLEVQKHEIETRRTELDLRLKQEQYHFEYSKAALNAQLDDRCQDRAHEKGFWKLAAVFAGLVILGLFILGGIAITYGKEEFFLELVKAIAFAGIGGFGGYNYGARKAVVGQMSPKQDTE